MAHPHRGPRLYIQQAVPKPKTHHDSTRLLHGRNPVAGQCTAATEYRAATEEEREKEKAYVNLVPIRDSLATPTLVSPRKTSSASLTAVLLGLALAFPFLLWGFRSNPCQRCLSPTAFPQCVDSAFPYGPPTPAGDRPLPFVLGERSSHCIASNSHNTHKNCLDISAGKGELGIHQNKRKTSRPDGAPVDTVFPVCSASADAMQLAWYGRWVKAVEFSPEPKKRGFVPSTGWRCRDEEGGYVAARELLACPFSYHQVNWLVFVGKIRPGWIGQGGCRNYRQKPKTSRVEHSRDKHGAEQAFTRHPIWDRNRYGMGGAGLGMGAGS